MHRAHDDPAALMRARLDSRAKPLGSLGRIEGLTILMAGLQRTATPVVSWPLLLVAAGDHGAAAHVSAFPSSVTAAMVRTIRDGRAASSVLAAQLGCAVQVLDANAAAGRPGGTRSWIDGPAMTADERDAAMQAGADAVAAMDGTVLLLGEMGIGNTASAALLGHKVASLPLVAGPGAGLDPAGVLRKQAAMEGGAARTAGCLPPLDALAEYGGFEVCALLGALLAAAERRVLVLVDGLIVTAAALAAHAIDPGCLRACVFAHRSAEPGHDAMLAHLGAEPLLDLGLRLGEGTGALLALPLLRAAAALPGMAGLDEVL